MIKEISRKEVPEEALKVHEHNTAQYYKEWIWSMRAIGKKSLGELTPEEWFEHIKAEEHFLLEEDKLWCVYIERGKRTYKNLVLWTGSEWLFCYTANKISEELAQKIEEL